MLANPGELFGIGLFQGNFSFSFQGTSPSSPCGGSYSAGLLKCGANGALVELLSIFLVLVLMMMMLMLM